MNDAGSLRTCYYSCDEIINQLDIGDEDVGVDDFFQEKMKVWGTATTVLRYSTATATTMSSLPIATTITSSSTTFASTTNIVSTINQLTFIIHLSKHLQVSTAYASTYSDICKLEKGTKSRLSMHYSGQCSKCQSTLSLTSSSCCTTDEEKFGQSTL